MRYTSYTKEAGEEIELPQGFYLEIEETSNGVYQLDLYDELGRSVGIHDTNLDQMFDRALHDLLKMKGE